MPRKIDDNVVVIVVEPSDSNFGYVRAMKEIVNSDIAKHIVVSFYGREESNIFGEIKTYGSNNERVLIINENAPTESIPSFLKKVASLKNDSKLLDAINEKKTIRLLSSY